MRLTERIRTLEQRREAAKPIAPILVVTSSQDEATERARFRELHGTEPGMVIVIRRACARKRPPDES